MRTQRIGTRRPHLRVRIAERMRQYQAELMAKLEQVHAQADEEAKRRPDVLLERAGLLPDNVDSKYAAMHHGKQVNASQSKVLNKTAGAHRGAESKRPQPSSPSPSAPAAKRKE